MAFLLNPRFLAILALAGILAFSHFTVYRKGKHVVQQEWEASVAAANAESRRLEQRRQDRAAEAESIRVAANARIRADLVRTGDQLVGLRATLDATERRAQESAEAATRLVSTYRAVFESCTAEYRAMGAEAAGHAADSMMYQDGWPK